MTSLLIQNPFRYAHERFARGGSWTEFTYALAVIAGLFVLLAVVHIYQQRRASGRLDDDPRKLFRVVLGRLGLGVLERDLLRRMSRDLDLDHPAILLLSPTIFRQHVHRWRRMLEQSPTAGPPPTTADLDAISQALFDRPLK